MGAKIDTTHKPGSNPSALDNSSVSNDLSNLKFVVVVVPEAMGGLASPFFLCLGVKTYGTSGFKFFLVRIWTARAVHVSLGIIMDQTGRE